MRCDPVELWTFAHLVSADFHPINKHRIRRNLRDRHGQSDVTIRQWHHHWSGVAFQILEATLERRPDRFKFCFGIEPTLADGRNTAA